MDRSLVRYQVVTIAGVDRIYSGAIVEAFTNLLIFVIEAVGLGLGYGALHL
jgi:hypothetical protein